MDRSKFKTHVRSLGNLGRRPWRLKLLAIEAGLTLWFIRDLLRFVPYARWKHRLSRSGKTLETAPPAVAALVTDIVWAVDRVSRRAPEQLMCLPRALAVCQMMKRRGWFGTLEIGVKRDERGQFSAHAWVVYDGKVIIGDLPDLPSYVRLDNWPTVNG